MYHKNHIFPDGNLYCAVLHTFQNLAVSNAGFGETPSEAVRNLNDRTQDHRELSDFEIGIKCRGCHCFVPDDFAGDGCNAQDCGAKKDRKKSGELIKEANGTTE